MWSEESIQLLLEADDGRSTKLEKIFSILVKRLIIRNKDNKKNIHGKHFC